MLRAIGGVFNFTRATTSVLAPEFSQAGKEFTRAFHHSNKELSRIVSDARKYHDALYDMMSIVPYNFDGAQTIASKYVFPYMPVTYANELCNHLLRTNQEFRAICQNSLLAQIHSRTPHVTWSPLLDGKIIPAFRSIDTTWVYGRPELMFTLGMPASIFNIRSWNAGLVPAKIVTYEATRDVDGEYKAELNEPDRHDMVGFIFGANMSTSLSIGHVLDQRFTAPSQRHQKDRYVYLMALTEGFSVGDAIYDGSGYIRDRQAGLRGAKGVSCQEDSCEVGAGVYVPSQSLIGVRLIKANGELGPLILNPKATPEMLEHLKQYVDVMIFMEANTVAEIRKLEALMLSNPAKVEDYLKRMTAYHSLDTELTRQINMEAKHKHNPSLVVSELLRQQYCTKIHEGRLAQLSLFAKSKKYADLLESGTLLDAKDGAFHRRKARSEEELKQRAIQAKKLATEKPEVDTQPIYSKKMQ